MGRTPANNRLYTTRVLRVGGFNLERAPDGCQQTQFRALRSRVTIYYFPDILIFPSLCPRLSYSGVHAAGADSLARNVEEEEGGGPGFGR